MPFAKLFTMLSNTELVGYVFMLCLIALSTSKMSYLAHVIVLNSF